MIALENRAAGKKLDSGHFLRRKSELAQRAKDGPAALAFDRRIIAETIRVDHGRRATSPAGEFRRGPLRPMILDNAHGASLVFCTGVVPIHKHRTRIMVPATPAVTLHNLRQCLALFCAGR
jgi:hypothetical protein